MATKYHIEISIDEWNIILCCQLSNGTFKCYKILVTSNWMMSGQNYIGKITHGKNYTEKNWHENFIIPLNFIKSRNYTQNKYYDRLY